jgi:NADPH-dependent 2,4-dienoyl-CoA reductase/sulfur reductase-like enzyme
VLPTLDPELGVKVGQTLRRHGVEVVTGATVAAVEADGKGLAVRSDAGEQWAGDLVVLAAGVAPASDLARHAGLATGEGGAIRVDRSMRTSRAEVFAAGDCAETWHRVLGRAAYLPLGTTSHKQGRVAGENAVGGRREFAGAVGTQVVKVFDWAFARTGLLEPEARRAGFEPLTAAVECWDHKSYYPGARRLWLRVTGDRGSGRLLGAQIAGHWQAQVAKRIDVFAAALFAALTVEEVSDLDLSYTPPLGSPWDAIQMAAQAWEGARRICRCPGGSLSPGRRRKG